MITSTPTSAGTAQDDTQASYIGLLSRDDGRIDWHQPADTLERMVRAYDPWPGTFCTYGEAPLRILSAQAIHTDIVAEPGHLYDTPAGPAVVCGAGALLLVSVQAAGSRAMAAQDWRRGQRATDIRFS